MTLEDDHKFMTQNPGVHPQQRNYFQQVPDSYIETLYPYTFEGPGDAYANVGNAVADGYAWAQSFTGNGDLLLNCEFFMYAVGTGPTSLVFYAMLHAHTGVFGTSSIGTGNFLAASDSVAWASVPNGVGNVAWVVFTFSGGNQVTLQKGVNYVLGIKGTPSDANDYGLVRYLSTPGDGHPGNVSSWNGSGTWTGGTVYATRELLFRINQQ